LVDDLLTPHQWWPWSDGGDVSMPASEFASEVRPTVPSLPPFTLRQLEYLVAAAETGTIISAAERMHVSPSTMSDAITQLERLLHTRLCVRRKAQGLTLTRAGEQAVADARVLLRGAHELYASLVSSADELFGPVSIGCFPTLAPTVLPPLLTAFAERHPRLDVEVIEASQDRLAELLASGRVDVAFLYDVQLPRSVRRKCLFTLPPHVLLPAGHRLAAAPHVRLEDLADENFIMLDSPPSSTHALSIFDARGVSPRIRHRTGNPDVVRTLVGRGLGYGMLVQRHMDPRAVRGFPVVMKEIAPAVPPLSIDVVWPAEYEPTPRTRAVIAFAQDVEWPRVEQGPLGDGHAPDQSQVRVRTGQSLRQSQERATG
jgi:DNA-binding transcriptional LysR family regulator